jgi:hypothetical protein
MLYPPRLKKRDYTKGRTQLSRWERMREPPTMVAPRGNLLAHATWTAAHVALLVISGCSEKLDPPPAAGIVFREVTAEAGIDFKHANGMTGEFYYPEIMGGGLCFFDADGDQDLDLYLVNGADLPEAALDSPPRNVLYRNNGEGTFTDTTEFAGVGNAGYGQGCCAADYDADGDVDLYVTNFGRNVLYENQGGGKFVDSTSITRTGNDRWGQGCAFVDVDLDGDLDLYVQNYLDYNLANNKECYNMVGIRGYCSPLSYGGEADILYANNGDGTFSDRTLEAGLYKRTGKGMGLLWFDPDSDGDPDLYVANDEMQNFFFMNRGDGTFEETSLLAGVGFDNSGDAEASMGVDAGDFDGDGDLDVIVPCLHDEGFTLYVNESEGFFSDGTDRSGLTTITNRFTGFSPAFLDFDNDGALDLFFTTGRVAVNPQIVHQPDRSFPESYGSPDLLCRNDGNGAFHEATRPGTYFREPTVGRGAAIGDYDNDGGVDVALIHLSGRAALLRNEVPDRGNWIGVSLEGNPPNRHGYGAVVRCKAGGKVQMRLVRDGGGYLSKNDPRAHFGVGAEERVDWIEVRWPLGKVSTIDSPPLNRYIRVVEPFAGSSNPVVSTRDRPSPS